MRFANKKFAIMNLNTNSVVCFHDMEPTVEYLNGLYESRKNELEGAEIAVFRIDSIFTRTYVGEVVIEPSVGYTTSPQHLSKPK